MNMKRMLQDLTDAELKNLHDMLFRAVFEDAAGIDLVDEAYDTAEFEMCDR